MRVKGLYLLLLTEAAQEAQEAVDEVNDPQEKLQEADAQQGGEEGHMPNHSFRGLQAHRAPQRAVVQVVRFDRAHSY